jgi:hypothetical protein
MQEDTERGCAKTQNTAAERDGNKQKETGRPRRPTEEFTARRRKTKLCQIELEALPEYHWRWNGKQGPTIGSIIAISFTTASSDRCVIQRSRL